MINDEFGETPQYFFVWIRIGRIKEDLLGFLHPLSIFGQNPIKSFFILLILIQITLSATILQDSPPPLLSLDAQS